MLTGESSEEEETALLTKTLAELDEVLEHNSAARDTAIRILGTRLSGPLKESSWDELIESLGAFLGPPSVHLLSWVTYGDWQERMSQVSALGSPAAVGFVQELVGIFGHDIRKAMTLRAELPDDWQGITYSVLEQLIGGGYRIRVDVNKVNGEAVRLEGPPDSILTLAKYLVEALNAVADSEAFSRDKVEAFRERVEELEKILAADRPSGTSQGVEATAQHVARTATSAAESE
jgi:hypothetical protein